MQIPICIRIQTDFIHKIQIRRKQILAGLVTSLENMKMNSVAAKMTMYTYTLTDEMLKIQGCHFPVMIKFPDFSRHFKGTFTDYWPSQQ